MQHETLASPQVQALHPLRATAMAAEEVLRQARAKVDVLVEDSKVSFHDFVWLSAIRAEADAEEALDRARAQIAGSDCPRVWTVCEDRGTYRFTAPSAQKAIDIALRNADGLGSQTFLRVLCRETGECRSYKKTCSTRINP